LQTHFFVLKDFKVIAFTHRKTPLDQVGRYHIESEFRKSRLDKLKSEVNVSELLYLSTCNRVEFILLTDEELNIPYLSRFFKAFAPNWNSDEIHKAIEQSQVLSGDEAIRHVFHVAASLDSLVVGEREIITQVRSAFEVSVKDKLCGDSIRLLIRKVIESSKEVFTATPIARNPVSVVSLAYRQLRSLNVKKDARFIIVGAGQTNTNLCKYLYKHGFRNFAVFNRSIENGQLLAQTIGGAAFPLDSLSTYHKGFDVLVTCTSSADYLIDTSLYKQLLQSDKDSKIVIDLAIPNDVDPHIFKEFDVRPILVESLKQLADENRAFRLTALVQCEEIIDKHFDEFRSMFRERLVERAMKDIPQKVKDIRNHATNHVFARELEGMDDSSRQVLEKMLTYFEKKYISVPMKMAKEILLDKH
jgi:glutamyl-tRNA reductase